VQKTLLILGLIATVCLTGCGRGDPSSTSQQHHGGQSIAKAGVSQAVRNPFPGARDVRLFVQKEYGPDSTPIFSKPGGRLLTASELAEFERVLRIEKTPEWEAACFIPHHFFRYYDERGKQIGEIKICFCCRGVSASEGAKISLGSDQILDADFYKLEALVHRLGESTDVLCD
jgi:hypothetical protein